MGLLDEAIREHLELKRRSGADPSVVAREEREALAPVLADGSAGEPDLAGLQDPEAEAPAPAPAVPAQELPHVPEPLTREARPIANFSSVGQETAELDMQAVMDEDPDAADSASPVGPIVAGPTPPAYAGKLPVEDGPDWEPAGDSGQADAPPAEIPGQERLTFE